MRAPASLLLSAAVFAATVASIQNAAAQSPDMPHEGLDTVRFVKHPDGATSLYRRGIGANGKREMTSETSTAKGELASRNVYFTGTYNHLTACHIFDNKNVLLYKVAYGYDKDSRLVEERMFDAKDGKVVQRVLYYYDTSGNRSKPVVINLNTAIPTIRPTMEAGNPYEKSPSPAARPAKPANR